MDEEQNWTNPEDGEGTIEAKVKKTLAGKFLCSTWLFEGDDPKIRNPPEEYRKNFKPEGTLLAPFSKEHCIEYFPSIKKTVLYSRDPERTKKGTKWVKNAKPEKPPTNLNVMSTEDGPILYGTLIDKDYRWMSKLDGDSPLILLASDKNLKLFEIPAEEPPIVNKGRKNESRKTLALEATKELPLTECGFMTSYGKNNVMVIKTDGNGTIYQLNKDDKEYKLEEAKTFKFPSLPEKLTVDDKLGLFFVLIDGLLSVYQITSKAHKLTTLRGKVEKFYWSQHSKKLIVNGVHVYQFAAGFGTSGIFKAIKKVPEDIGLHDAVLTRSLIIGIQGKDKFFLSDKYLVCLPLTNPSNKKLMRTIQDPDFQKLALERKPSSLKWFPDNPPKKFWKKDFDTVKILDEDKSLLLHVHGYKSADSIGWIRDFDTDIEYHVRVDTNDILGYNFKDLGLKPKAGEVEEAEEMVPEEKKDEMEEEVEEKGTSKKGKKGTKGKPAAKGKAAAKGSAAKEEEEKEGEEKEEAEKEAVEEKSAAKGRNGRQASAGKRGAAKKNGDKMEEEKEDKKSASKGKNAKKGEASKKEAEKKPAPTPERRSERTRKQPSRGKDDELEKEVKKPDKRGRNTSTAKAKAKKK